MSSARIAVTGTFDVPADVETAWTLLSTPDEVVACLEGAEVHGIAADGTLDGSLSLKLGPTTAHFRGTVQPDYRPDEREVHLVAVGADGNGRSRARATTVLRLVPRGAASCTVSIEGAIDVTGGLAGFLRAGGNHLAQRMVDDFGRALAARCASDPAAAPPAAAPRPLRPVRLLGRAALDAIRSTGARLRARLRRRPPKENP